ncbi:MAG: formate--tetrahydrofolate ligase [Bacilli bacterium]|jgi:formate--tetrahydrofolate ligase
MKLKNIQEIADIAGIDRQYVEQYGNYKAKIDMAIFDEIKKNNDGKLILVTAITPTKVGEGKTTTSIALAEGLAQIGQKAILTLREPSLGPVFGLKGGATGGGLASIEPSEDINLHFTGDMHALTSSINLISAIIDNHIFQGNELNINPDEIVWNRALDMNDRALRNITIAQGEKNGVERKDSFVITVASEMMAIMCLADDEKDFERRVNNITVAYTFDKKRICVKDLKISHAVLKLMRQALKPNLVQTCENNPVFVHGGPFANIAHGCNSIISLKLALKLSPIVITEAGFGADLGAEKFFDICCHFGGFKPDGVVMVATIRALKLHGGQPYESLAQKNIEALKKGIDNLKTHLENIKKFNVPVIVAINHFANDSEEEISTLQKWCEDNSYSVSFLDGFLKGGAGSKDLADSVLKMLSKDHPAFKPLYDVNDSIEGKITKICKEIYRAGDVVFEEKAKKQIDEYNKNGFAHTPICMAKTPLSLTDNPKIQGSPKEFSITIREIKLSSGAEFLVALTGSIMTMPGLPKIPAAIKMQDEDI